jgi:flagellar secretion chaperone FliS
MTITAEYLENQVLTASPHRLHLMVIDGAIRFARMGLASMREQRWETMGQNLDRARDCVTELIGGLNSASEPQMAEQMKALFVFSYRSLIAGELERLPQRIEDAIRILNMHRETWVELGLKLQSDPGAAVTRQQPPTPHLSLGRSWTT